MASAMSRNEEILQAIIEGADPSELGVPQSREEALLMGVLEKIGNIEPSPEQIAEAVSEWLDDHPEATTTVEDGAISYAKLDNSLQGTVDEVSELKTETTQLVDNALIIQETSKAYFHDVAPVAAKFYPNALTQNAPIGYVGSPMLLSYSAYNSGTDSTSGITRTPSGRFLMLSGVGSGSGNLVIYTSNDNALNGKTVNVAVYIKKSTNWEANGKINILVNNSSIAGESFSESSSNGIGWTILKDISMPATVSSFRIRIDSGGKQTFATGDYLWFGIYTATPIITESVATTDPVEVDSISDLNYIDTMMHESTVDAVVPTKDYVDSHTPDIIGYWNEHVYALPEDFGAVGDGVTDDAQAMAECFAYAVTSGKPVRGFGKYKTSVTLNINWRYADVYLREIVYTGNGAAVIIQERDGVFEFHRIQSSGIGISFAHNDSATISASRIQVKGNAIDSDNHCIEIKDKALYCTCDIRKLSSVNGDCIHRTEEGIAEFAGEFTFRSSACSCPNGYVSYNVTSCKFYDFTIESNCRYGLLNPQACCCTGFRHREQIDLMRRRIENDDVNNGGAFIVFTRDVNSDGIYGFKYISSDPLLWYSIDVSAVQGYAQSETVSEWMHLIYNAIDLGVPIRNERNVIGSKMYFVGNNKVYAPEGRKEIAIDDDTVDFRLFDSTTDADIKAAAEIAKYYATDWIIDAQQVDIYFNASFGAIGYNDLTITQHDGNTCMVYDKLGNVIFDGTSEGDSKWSLKCIMDTTSYGRFTDYYSGSIGWRYDGTNEIWEITKLS